MESIPYGAQEEDGTQSGVCEPVRELDQTATVHGVKLDKREKAIAMVEMAQLTTAECVAVLCIAKFEEGVDDSDLDLRMKEAMRTIASNIMGKESAPETANAVLALEYENREQTLHDGGRHEGSTV